MSEILSLIIAGLFLYVYIILSSIELGSSLFIGFPKITSHKEMIKAYMSPVWEVTNLFLVFFAISLLVFFPGAVNAIDPIVTIIITALVALAIRVVCILYVYFTGSHRRILRVAILLASFAAPVILSQVLLYIMTGKVQILSVSSLFMALLVVSIMVAIAVSFFKVMVHETYKRNLYTVLGISLAVLISSINGLVLTLMYPNTQLLSEPTVNIFFCTLSSLTLIVLFYAYSRKKLMLLFVSICVFVAVLLGTFFAYQLPYLVYPDVTIYQSFTNPTVFPWLFGSFVTAFLFVVPTIVLLYLIFIFKKKRFKI